MKNDEDNPLNMTPEPFSGDGFVLPKTWCSSERKLFLRRINEILSFLHVTKHSFDECKKNYKKVIPTLPRKEQTPMKLVISENFMIMPAKEIIRMTTYGLDVLTRQIFVMLYGSFETYLFQLFDTAFHKLCNKDEDDILDKSLDMLMRRKWDSKFCKMNDVFNVGFKAGDLNDHFSGLKMDFEKETHKNPLSYLDELAQIRHRIVHASSILEKDKMIYVQVSFLPGFNFFFFHLTDYIDTLFSEKFKLPRFLIGPSKF